jgi:hypothetical protein
MAVKSYCLSQQSIVRGTVSYFNSRTDSGIIKYISGVDVEDDFDRAQSTETDNDGNFQLFYYKVDAGKAISFHVLKDPLQVVNFTSLNAVAGQADLIRISMALPVKLADYRKELYRVGKTESEKRLLAEIEHTKDSIHQLSKANRIHQDKIAILNKKIDSLQSRDASIPALAAEFVAKYGTVNLDFAPTTFINSFNLYRHGLIDSALHVLERADLRGVAFKAFHTKDSLQQEEKKIAVSAARNSAILSDAIKSLELMADLYATQLEYDSVVSCYKSLVVLDSNNDKNYYQYAFYLSFFGKSDSARRYYLIAMRKTNKPQVIAAILNNLSSIYERDENYSMAYEALHTSLHLRDSLSKRNVGTKTDFAITLHNLAKYFADKYQIDSAEFYYKKALGNYDPLSPGNQDYLVSCRAQTNEGLAILYSEIGRLESAEKYLNLAISDRGLLNNRESLQYDPALVSMQNALAHVYINLDEYQKAKGILTILEGEFKALSDDRQESVKSQFARTEYNFADLYFQINQFALAYSHVLISYHIRKEIIEKKGNIGDFDYITTLALLGQIYNKRNQPDSGREMLKTATGIIEAHRKLRGDAFKSQEAHIFVNLAQLAFQQNDFEAALAYCRQGLNVFSDLAKGHSEAYLRERVFATSLVGQLYYNMDTFVVAIEQVRAALDMSSNIEVQSVWQRAAINEPIVTLLGICYDDGGQYDSAKKYLDSALIYSNILVSKDTNALFEGAEVHRSRGNLYLDIGNGNGAKQEYWDSFLFFKRKSEEDRITWESYLAIAENDLGNSWGASKDYDSAKFYYEKSLETWENCVKRNGDAFNPSYAMVLANLGQVNSYTVSFDASQRSLSYFSRALKIYEKLSSQHPEIYDSAFALTKFRTAVANGKVGNVKIARDNLNELIEYCNARMNSRPIFFSRLKNRCQNILKSTAEGVSLIEFRNGEYSSKCISLNFS